VNNLIDSLQEMSQDSTLFVGNLEPTCASEQLEAVLYELFTQCGPVQSIRIPTDNGRNKGFAFLEMRTIAAATYAILALNGVRLHGRYIRVACAMDNEKECQLRIENLPANVKEIDVYEALSHKVKGVRGVSIRRNHLGRSECKATIWFGSIDDVELAKTALTSKSLHMETNALRIVL
jgi:RNA recognition motif-containing protein